MAGGIFKKNEEKVRPGVYVNVVNGRPKSFATLPRGNAIIMLDGYDYGPRDQFLKITNLMPNKYEAQFGRSIYEDNKYMLMLQLIMQNATNCYVYIPDGGTKAKTSVTLPVTADPAKVGVTSDITGDSTWTELESIIKYTEPESGNSKMSDSDYGKAWLINALQIGAAASTALPDDVKMAIYALNGDSADLTAKLVSDGPRVVTYTLTLAGKTYIFTVSQDPGEEAASAVTMTITAKYKGSLGNSFQVVSVANPVGGYDISVYVDGAEVETFEQMETIEDLADISDYVDFSGSGELSAFASATLEGGDDKVSGNRGYTTFLDKSEKIRFNVMCFPTEDKALQAAVLTKIRYIREGIGWKCQAVVPNFDSDYEGIINLTNRFEYNEQALSWAEACAWLTGAEAGAAYNESLTYKLVDGATGVIDEKSNEESIEAIKNGETFFSLDENGDVILEYDINSRTTVDDDTPPSIHKNRVLRVYDSWCNDCLMEFRPGATDNEADGWNNMEGTGKAMLKAYEADHAITDVNLGSDFLVDREKSTDDKVYITAGLKAVDSADKYYITTYAR